MPSLPDCDHDPFANHPTIRGAALVTGHRRWCELMDPDHPDYNPRVRDAYIRTTYRLAGMTPAPADFPPLAQQAANLAGAVGRFIASGMATTTTEERARRLAICEGCEFFVGKRCQKCGCSLAAKVAMASEHCPIGKW